MSKEYNYAYFDRVPINGAALTADGTNLVACRITGKVQVDPKYRKKIEDENESGELVGEKHFDKETIISLTIKVTAAFVFPALKSLVVIASSDTFNSVFNGNWLLDEQPAEFSPGEAAEVKIKLRFNENMPLT